MGNPTWMYKRGQFGRHESQIFDSDECAKLGREGWVDSPAKLAEPPKPGRKPKGKVTDNGDS